MSDWIYDHDDNDYLYRLDDDHAIGSDGHIVQNAGDNWGFDINTGEFHMTSDWDPSDSDPDDDSFDDPFADDDDPDSYDTGRTSSGSSTAYRAPSPAGKTTYSSTSSARQPSDQTEKTDQKGVGCATILWGFSAALLIVVLFGMKEAEPTTYLLVTAVLIYAAVRMIGSMRSSSSGSGSSSSSSGSGGSRAVHSGGNDDRGVDTHTYYRFAKVRVAKDNKEYFYWTNDRSIRAGDYVIVPDPDGVAGVPAEVVDVRLFEQNRVPVPLAEARSVKKKIDAETYASLADGAEETPGEDESDPERPGNKARVVRIVVLAAVIIAAIVSFPAIRRNFTEWKAEQDYLKRRQLISAFMTKYVLPFEDRVTENLTEEFTNESYHQDLRDVTKSFSVRIESEVTDREDGGSLLHETVFVDVKAKEAFEKLSDVEKEACLSEYGTSAVFRLSRFSYTDLAEELDLERVVSGHVTITTDENTYEADREQDDTFAHSYYDLNGQHYDVVTTPRPRHTATPKPTPTPGPTPTPRRKSSSSRPITDPDEYDTDDYSNPDFFYDDYYDDFYDYDEAEEYWDDYWDW